MSRFGHADRRRPLEVVVARVKAIARSAAPLDAGPPTPSGAEAVHRPPGDCDGCVGASATYAHRRAGRAATADLGAGDPDAVGHDDPGAAGLAGATTGVGQSAHRAGGVSDGRNSNESGHHTARSGRGSGRRRNHRPGDRGAAAGPQRGRAVRGAVGGVDRDAARRRDGRRRGVATAEAADVGLREGGLPRRRVRGGAARRRRRRRPAAAGAHDPGRERAVGGEWGSRRWTRRRMSRCRPNATPESVAAAVWAALSEGLRPDG